MFSEKSYLLLFLLPLFISCTASRRLAHLQEVSSALDLSLPSDTVEVIEPEETAPLVDTVPQQDGPVIMNAIRDSRTGEMTATDVISASRVVARFRNVAERDGHVSLTFNVTVPAGLADSRFQLRLSPLIRYKDVELALDPVLITGEHYRERQLRGYERYRKFIDSIISDSTVFIRTDQLEKFLERNFPETFRMKNDSSLVPEPLAENLFGVSQRTALEHYTRRHSWSRNEWKKKHREDMFRKYVKSPILTENIRLDTVITSSSGDMVYQYTRNLEVPPRLKKIEIALSGKVYEDGESVLEMPSPEHLVFYISSLSTLADDTPRYLFRVVERNVQDNTNAFLDFDKGSRNLDTLRPGNASELARIRRCFSDIFSRKDLVVDSIVVEASCSPEGRYAFNAELADGRSRTVREHVMSVMLEDTSVDISARSVPENWEYFRKLVSSDTLIRESSKEKMLLLSREQDKDEAERQLSLMGEYRYLREKIYPKLRTVSFRFYMHRPDVQKDTIHTTELDPVYMQGLQALKDLDYKKAASLLKPYGDYNSALALASCGYDHTALSVLDDMEVRNAESSYLRALLLSRIGRTEEASLEFSSCVEMEESMIFRANLDPEMAVVAERYRRNKEAGENGF